MDPTLPAPCCPECGCARVIDAARGPTCTACGLVIEETTTFVVHEAMGKDGVISSHAILHGNTTTLVGKPGERGTGNGAALSRVQQRAVSYVDAKQSRVYHLVSAATAAAQLPGLVVSHAMHAAAKVAALAPKGSSMAGTSMVAALSVFVACKKLGVTLTSDEISGVLASLDVIAKVFKRNLLKLRALGKGKGLGGGWREGALAGGATVVNAALAAIREVMGPGDWLSTITLVHSRIARALVGMRDDSATAVTAYLAMQVLAPAGVPLTLLSKAVRFRAASLYNAVKRVLNKLGIIVEGPLSRANLTAIVKARVLVGGGVVKEIPVQIAAGEDEPWIIPAAPIASAAPAVVVTRGTTARFPPSIPITFTHSRGRMQPRSVLASPIPIAPSIDFMAARGNALRSLGRRGRGRPRTWSPTGPVGPPITTLATGLGPPVPVCLLAAIDGG